MVNQAAPVANLYNAGAATWSRSAELLTPVTTALASWLGPVAAGGTVLDVACGRGEPGLSLVEATPAVSLVGIDIARAMIDGARAEATRRAIAGARFEVGSAEDLPLDDSSVDAVVSRMGMLGFPGASMRTAHEAFRVLRPGGRLAIAVWDLLSGQTALAAAVAACHELASVDALDLSWMDALADGRRERWLNQAGFGSLTSEPITWMMHFADRDAVWGMASSAPPVVSAFAALDEAGHAAARERHEVRVARYRRPDGSYSIPVSARIITATKPS